MAAVYAREGALSVVLDDRGDISAAAAVHLVAQRQGLPGSAANKPVLAPWQVSFAIRTMQLGQEGPISIARIARLCGLSPSYFVRAFSNTVGIAPYAWFARQRVDRAKSLLTETDMPLAQLALECGFSDQAHFTKSFAKVTGLTPARWRRGIRSAG